MSKPDLSSIFKLEFYKKQDTWKLASKPRRRGKAKGVTRKDFNKTYTLNKSTANITTKLNNAFIEIDADSLAEDSCKAEGPHDETQITNSFNELWSDPEDPEREEQPLISETTKIDLCPPPNTEQTNVFIQNLPLPTDLWSEKVDFELNDCSSFIGTPGTPQTVANAAKALENQNILVNLLNNRKFFIKQRKSKGGPLENVSDKENNENLPQSFEQKNCLQNEQEYNKIDLISRLKQKIFKQNLLNNNFLIPNINQQPVHENNDFNCYLNNIEKTIEDAKRSLSQHEKNFEMINQEQRNFERNFIEATTPFTYQTDSQINRTEQMADNVISAQYINDYVKTYGNINQHFHYVPTQFIDNSQNIYLNQNAAAPQNQFIINNYKPIFYDQKFKPLFGDNHVIMRNYEAYLNNCHILIENNHPKGVANNFETDEKNIRMDSENLQNYNCQYEPQNLQNNPRNFENTPQSFNSAGKEDIPLQNTTQHSSQILPQSNQIPMNHQIFVRNPQTYDQIIDPVLASYPDGLGDHCDPCFEWTEPLNEQVFDDIDGIWSEGQEALNEAAQWLNLVVDEENLDLQTKQICTEIEDLNLNATSSTDSATFMQRVALVPHSSEIELCPPLGIGDHEKYELASLVQRHATALKNLLSKANSDVSVKQTQSPITQHKRHSATNTTPNQSCDYFPTKDVGSNLLIEPANPTDLDFDAKLDQLREKLAQDQVRLENQAAAKKMYTAFEKYQHYKHSPLEQKTKQFLQPEHKNLEFADQFEHADRNLEQADQKLEQTDRNEQSIEHNVRLIEHNGHHNMPTVDRTEKRVFKHISNNVGPYSRQKRLHSQIQFNYLSSTKADQINKMCLH